MAGLKFITPTTSKALVLARCKDELDPPYIIVAKTRCYECQQWCWLGDETFKLINSGEAVPLCGPCAAQILEPQIPIDAITDRLK